MEAGSSPSFERHPALKGRAEEARALADVLRRLIRLSVSTAAPAEETAELTAELTRIADRLHTHLPQEPIPRSVRRAGDGPTPSALLTGAMPFDLVVGPFNPLAPPMTLEFDPPKAMGRATFDVPYEGAPGCVHGAALAAAFDIVLTAANSVAGATGPTVRLNLRYRLPTLLGEETLFEGWVTEVTERRVFSLGRIIQGGVVTVEAEGEFAVFDRAGIDRMAKGRRAAFDEVMSPAPH